MSEKSAGCACNADPFASLPLEMRPRKGVMSGLRKVVCPVCGLNYWTCAPTAKGNYRRALRRTLLRRYKLNPEE